MTEDEQQGASVDEEAGEFADAATNVLVAQLIALARREAELVASLTANRKAQASVKGILSERFVDEGLRSVKSPFGTVYLVGSRYMRLKAHDGETTAEAENRVARFLVERGLAHLVREKISTTGMIQLLSEGDPVAAEVAEVIEVPEIRVRKK